MATFSLELHLVCHHAFALEQPRAGRTARATEAGGLFGKMPAVISKAVGSSPASAWSFSSCCRPGEWEGQLPKVLLRARGQLGCPHCWGPGSPRNPAGCDLIPHRIQYSLSWTDPEGSAPGSGGGAPWLLASAEALHPLGVEGSGQGQ